MKYIRHKHLGFIIFGKTLGHDQIANYFGGKEEVISAGFVERNTMLEGELFCHGKSTTLNICAGQNDTKDVNNLTRMS